MDLVLGDGKGVEYEGGPRNGSCGDGMEEIPCLL